jgi:tRNA (cmo5U34)-methyltransferase
MASMQQNPTDNSQAWSAEDTADFINYGDFFVPHRKLQFTLICDIVAGALETAVIPNDLPIVEIGCGAGQLSEALLEKLPDISILGLDGSTEMLEEASMRLARFGNRFEARRFQLDDVSWRNFRMAGCVSSLVIHHLDDRGKQSLYRDLARLIAPGGPFVVADLVLPSTDYGRSIAAAEWDSAVLERAERQHDLRPYQKFRDLQWNYYNDPNSDPVDKPSLLLDQLCWLKEGGFDDVDVFWMRAGHVIFGGVARTPSA